MGTNTVLVIGGTGFVGRHVVNRLAAQGYRVLVPTRRRESARHLILLPTVEVIETDVADPVVLGRLATDAVAVINLAGILNETGRDTFEHVHVELSRQTIAACKAGGVRRLLHMSALHADPHGASRYLRTKGEAEADVMASGLDWTIFAPSVIFGREDAFLNLFARLSRLLPIMVLAGANARFQPIHVGDVAQCFVESLHIDATVGRRYVLCGPKAYTLRELVRYTGALTGHVRPIIALGPRLSQLQAFMLEHLPGKLMTRDNLASMRKDSVCEDPFPPEFGFAPAPLEALAPGYLSPAAVRSRYDDYRTQSGR